MKLARVPLDRIIPRIISLIWFGVVICSGLLLSSQYTLLYSADDDVDPPRNQTPIDLPFKGFWRVSQGNDGGFSHQGKAKYAWDFVRVDVEGNSTTDTILGLENYYTYKAEVYAPAPGVVIDIVRNSPDETPGVLVRDHPANRITIDHGNGEYSRIYHLMQKGIVVEVGQEVARGELLGYAGNSGPSTAPHLDYRLMEYEDGELTSMPAQFRGLIQYKDHRFSHHPTQVPVQGDIVCNRILFKPKVNISATLRARIQFSEMVHRLFFLTIDPSTFYLPTYKHRIHEALSQNRMQPQNYLEGALIAFIEGDMHHARRYLQLFDTNCYQRFRREIYQIPPLIHLPFQGEEYRIIPRGYDSYLDGTFRYVKIFAFRSDQPWIYVQSPVAGIVEEIHTDALPVEGLQNHDQPTYILIKTYASSPEEWIYLGYLDQHFLFVQEGQAVDQGTLLAKTDTFPLNQRTRLYMGRIIEVDGMKLSTSFDLQE